MARVSSPEKRSYGRAAGELRPTEIEPGFMRTATGSALISVGETRVICTASAEESVPRWMAGRGTGWVTAEYGMLPASTGERKQRDATRGRQDGRTVEIQRLIGRSLRGVVDFEALGERTIYLDCDVLQADGGTRCASITGAYVALALACARLRAAGRARALAADGLGGGGVVRHGRRRALLDLDYSEDSTAEVDANVVMTGDGGLVEVQATAERTPLSRAHLDELLALAAAGIEQLRADPGARDRRRAPPAGAAQRRPPALEPCGCCWRRTTSTSGASSRACSAPRRRGLASSTCSPTTWSCRRRTARRSPRTRSARRAPLRAATGRVSIADDSGIAAAALGGAPGVRSARYAGEHATDEREPRASCCARRRRAARWSTSARSPTLIPSAASSGCSRGAAPDAWPPSRAASGGFGYDPAFLPDDGRRGR